MKSRGRDSKFEILRIIAMFGIVLDHYLCFGGVQYYGTECNRLVAGFISILGGKTCNLIFIMISAWFCVDRERLLPLTKGTVKLIIKCMLYSLAGYLVSCVLWHGEFSLQNIFSSLLWMRVNYGFMTNYVLLMIIAPVLNILIKKASRETLGVFVLSIILFTLILYPIYSLPYVTINIEVYLAVGYIKRYCMDSFKRRNILAVLALSVLTIIVTQIIAFGFGKEYLMFLFDSEFDIAVIINSLCIFILVAKMPPINCGFINIVAGGISTVYLFHENIWIRDYLWEALNCSMYFSSPVMIVHCIGSCLLVMLVGMVTGVIYNFIESFIMDRFWSQIEGRLLKFRSII